MFIDTHAHMDHLRFSDRKTVLQAAKDSGIGIIVNPAIGYETNEAMEQLLKDYDWVYYAKGIHPNTVGTDAAEDGTREAELHRMLQNKSEKTVAVGETGLDFHRLSRENGVITENGMRCLHRQYEWFRKQLELAALYKLPVILHVRNAGTESTGGTDAVSGKDDAEHLDAHKETIGILTEYADALLPADKGIIHCFAGSDMNYANKYIEMGYLLGIGGAVTYEGNDGLREIVKQIPLSSIVLETDAPYVLPAGLPGKRNTPLNITHIAKYIAELRGISVKELEEATTQNALRLFRI